MIVGTYGTGDFLYGPYPSLSGMQEGTFCTGPCGTARQLATSLALHTQANWLRGMSPATGLSPVKPSSVPAVISTCAPQLGTVLSLNVSSLIANDLPALMRFGMSR